MKYLIYEDAVTHKFAFLPLPNRFDDGDALPVVVVDRWFDTHADAIAALRELFNRDENEPDVRVGDAGPVEDAVVPVNPRYRH
jgi:hypothetical protein